ncbi:regulatory protein RecX [Agrococcus jenensis]|uniref:Regulatory protein RecX n=1 Tax=Agrococcus jenensis TaxID=46353 RepID=A0A3N2AU96_9MICO|nr:regulatory protein RecX [Agrococcus jenensis]ROR66550.1 regulatory protein [Agrococcus jenensis]
MSDSDRLAGVTELSAWVARDAERDAEGFGDEPAAMEPVDEESARSIALRALGRRAASRQELDRTLERRDVEPEVRAAVLDRLEAEGLVDDAQLARDTAERLRERKHLGERGVAAELRKRGLDPDELDEADRDDELQRAIDAAAERRRRSGSLDDETAERRLTGYLQRRGFSGGTVRIAIERTRPQRSRGPSTQGPRFR